MSDDKVPENKDQPHEGDDNCILNAETLENLAMFLSRENEDSKPEGNQPEEGQNEEQ